MRRSRGLVTTPIAHSSRSVLGMSVAAHARVFRLPASKPLWHSNSNGQLAWRPLQLPFPRSSSLGCSASTVRSSTAPSSWCPHSRPSPTRALAESHGRHRGVALVARRQYVTLNELRQGGELRLVYTGPPAHTIRPVKPKRLYRYQFMRDVLILCLGLAFTPLIFHLSAYLAGLDKTSFERIVLWWLKYREKGPVQIHAGFRMVDGQELQNILDTKLGRPYTMEILETRLSEKLQALSENMDGVELLIMSGKKTVEQFTLPYISVGIHARIRWTETVKIVGPNGIAHLNVTLRTFSNPEKRDLSTQLLGGRPKRILIEKVELSFADNTSYVLNEASFGRQKRYTATKLKED